MARHPSPKSRATISVLCPTAHPGPLVSAVLEDLRAAVDEIIVAADARVQGEDLGHYALAADRVLRYEHFGANRHWSWLAAQAAGDWLLLLDGDELPSRSLIDALPELVADRRIDQYSLPIHWPWPDAATRLAVQPWQSDHRLRLMRNNGRTYFAGRKHVLAREDFPVRYLDELPVYHLDLLLPDVERRRAKVERYDSELFGLLTPEGLRTNEAFYLPEDTPDAGTAPIPDDDCERITRALAPRRQAPVEPVEPDDLPVHDRAAVAAHWAGRTLSDDAYRADVELARPLPLFSAAQTGHLVWVRVRNTGTATWPGGADRQPLITLGAGWRAPGSESWQDAGRATLPHAVDPGESILMRVALAAPQRPGPADLVLDVVHESVRWFRCPSVVHVDVGPSVADHLADLQRRHGPVAPLDAVMQVRTALQRHDALVDIHPSGASRPSDARIARFVEDLPIGVWALNGPTLDRLVDVVRAQRPSYVAEFGAGTSTVVLAWLLAKLHGRGRPRLISFEQDPAWVQRVRHSLAQRGLDDLVAVVHLPLGSGPNGSPISCYEMTDEGRGLLRDHPPQLLLIDGPTLASGASRLGVIDLVTPFLVDDATVLLDDAFRDAELCIGREWDRRPDMEIDGVRLLGKGLLEGRLIAQPGGAAADPRRVGRVRRFADEMSARRP